MTKTNGYEPRLKVLYEQELRPQLKDELGVNSLMQVPKVEKITLNMGVGEAKTDAKLLDSAMDELTQIAGQRAQLRRARTSIAGFKIRTGMPVGTKVTLRGARMYEFLDRLVSIAEVANTGQRDRDEKRVNRIRGYRHCFGLAGYPVLRSYERKSINSSFASAERSLWPNCSRRFSVL